VGLDGLRELAGALFGDEDPARVYYHTVPQRLRRVNGRYELQLQLPFISKEEVNVSHNEGELYVTVGAYKREISLPRILNGKQVGRARLDDGLLRITFTDSQK